MKNSTENLKRQAAEAALAYVKQDSIIGVGTGSTVNYFIDALAGLRGRIEGTVASSQASAERLKKHGIPVFDLNAVSEVAVYIDGADEVNAHRYMIKGGGGAHTREKILACAAKKFVCIVDASKQVEVLGKSFPVAVEVIPMARSYAARKIVQLGADPIYRERFVTDNQNVILDVYNLPLLDPVRMEQTLNLITGVVENGIFAQRPADVVLVAGERGISEF